MNREEKIREVVSEMLTQRDYKVEDQGENIFALKPNGKKMCVFGTIIQKLNSAEIQSHISAMESWKINHCIIIYENTPTPAVLQAIVQASNIGLTIEKFSADELQYNPTKHELVPKHTLLSSEEAELNTGKINGKFYPVLLRTDVIVRFYNFPRGSMIEINDDGFIRYKIVR